MQKASRRVVKGPDGQTLTLADLPPSGPIRWTPMRKAQIVLAIEAGIISIKDARDRYLMTMDEFLDWSHLYRAAGLSGLKEASISKRRRPEQLPMYG